MSQVTYLPIVSSVGFCLLFYLKVGLLYYYEILGCYIL